MVVIVWVGDVLGKGGDILSRIWWLVVKWFFVVFFVVVICFFLFGVGGLICGMMLLFLYMKGGLLLDMVVFME